jgi:hypothetical protein
MCRVDDCDEMSTIVQDERLVARKEHKCSECCRVIRVGETYNRQRLKFDGEMSTHKICAHCQVVRDWLGSECGGWVYGEMEEDIREHFFEGYEPRLTGRLAAGMHRFWTTIKGDLMKLPSIQKAA